MPYNFNIFSGNFAIFSLIETNNFSISGLQSDATLKEEGNWKAIWKTTLRQDTSDVHLGLACGFLPCFAKYFGTQG